MSTLRVSNIEAKADASSPSVNEKIKITNSNGDVLVHVNGEISGITTIGINTTGESVKFDSNQNATFSGIVTATQFFGDVTGNITGNIDVGAGNTVTATQFFGDVTGNITGNIDVGAGNTVTAENYFLRDGINISVPAGTVIYTAQNTAPDGYIKANGATISRTTYADLFSAIGTTFGAGDGSSTFVIPDLRGEFIRSWDDSRGIDSGRNFGTAQGEGLTAMRGEIYDSHGRAAMSTQAFGSGNNVFESTGNNSSYRSALQTTSTAFDGVRFDSTNVITEATSGGLRPRNIALLACIKF